MTSGFKARDRRRRSLVLTLCGVFLILAAPVQAGFWRCELPGGVYVVNLATVSSVSTHEYLVDGATRVTELTVGTQGAVVARFYFIELMVPKGPVSVGQAVVDKVQQQLERGAARVGGEEVWKKVVKSYPVTTHAHTVEYRLESVEQLNRLRDSLERAWRLNQDAYEKVSANGRE